MADRYLQSDGQTLKNKLGIFNDPRALAAKEAVHVNSRCMELRANGLPRGVQGFELVKAVHRYLFQDVYEWAGRPREIDLARALYAEGGSDVVLFTPAQRIEAEGRRLFDDLAAAGNLRGLTRLQFAEDLAPFFGRLNDLHPFREGNGRTQRLVWEHLARQAGHDLSFEGISRERMTVVSIAASAGDYGAARRMIGELLDPVRSSNLRTATRFFEAHRTPNFDWQDRYVATTEPGRSYIGTFVSRDEQNFLMHDGRNLYIGLLADLPHEGRDVKAGDAVTFRASQALEQRFREQVDTRAEQMRSEWAIEREHERQHNTHEPEQKVERGEALGSQRGHDGMDFDN